MKKIQLSIPQPCHQNWDDMTPTQQGRYCNACAREVTDFTGMSDTEVLNYFLKKKNEPVCGMSYPDQLNRTVAALPQKKRYWQWQYLLAAFLFFIKPVRSKSQNIETTVLVDSVHVNRSAAPEEKKKDDKPVVSGVIKDEKNNPVSYATIRIKGTRFGTQADSAGRFQLQLDKMPGIIQVSAVGYKTVEMAINDRSEKEIVLKMEMSTTMGLMVVCTKKKGRAKMSKLSKSNIIKDTMTNFFSPAVKVYLSPVSKGNGFTVSMKLKQTGDYVIQITNSTGELMKEKKIAASGKEYSEEFTSGSNWNAGVYYVKLMDDKGKLISTGSLAIQ